MARLRITEIFHSLQGETSAMGRPATFVRLTGCPLRCQYCDSAYAFHGGEWMELEEILARVEERTDQLVVVTGGEPLAQAGVHDLLQSLCNANREVYLETSGALSVRDVDPRVVKILDIKTPGSGESEKNHWQNLQYLSARDQVKFVLCDRKDYEWARDVVREHPLPVAEWLFSPSYGELDLRELAEWILADQLPVRLQVQLHKWIWGDIPGH
ncbi:7-carboxy-7-deazaguanine synthase QueE [Acidithiobacillus sp. CV18-2]|uniref:7-carboxy-7-deazaguanine synthase n=1 Tax=Igneacidithiobacillus copahuensis TaxID=2724909 RepID=A0AAE2YSJ3_9PROT|nr:7-carboxy-7-deazaguanine synthase QueE [Igneacidithiobacillus copahuensis]MBU2755134.1 7-carboxy-7-deazaguanine synthase QueE [Acidithiobacillus sp. CV18-3]MBU2758104.1 7-carboxy-7-deazaguanine synthase QueE [Acidithiobacillus sp. BN09-2]MBU2777718.1 7-carboxy-7-deazaguanine synthase QueE [Acidithiobacillus sp. CV18-2]MBU2797040.1 7-carboxy-7-deazaguanine synthase QueE [Acidithiobacillus sp. VAN18-2]MBU2798368.1 7-carboxy-7-deazaguanine synthase QueE [Acidithiobacillus sp. VAN18-4]UTV80720